VTNFDPGFAPLPGSGDQRSGAPDSAGRRWPFLSNHYLVLLSIAQEPGRRVRDISLLVGITERATQTILKDLIDGGYLERTRIGRRNRYRVGLTGGLRHPLLDAHTVGALLDALDDRAPYEPTLNRRGLG
jgi:hypothetical protein